MPPDDGAHKRPSLALRLEQFWHDNPGASLTTREGLDLFGGTGHSFRQAMTVLRRMGTPVRCERVFRLRHQETHGGTRRAPAAATWSEADAVAAAAVVKLLDTERERFARACEQRAESSTVHDNDLAVWLEAAQLIRNLHRS